MTTSASDVSAREPRVRLQCQVNGASVSIDVHPMARMLDVLRSDLRLSGTKEGCGEGECGACSILVDGEIVNSCLMPALHANGTRITTIEGIADAESMHAVQRAFIDHGGAQCGICTPGMILAAVALLDRTPNPDSEQVRHALAGNLCRCTGYVRIFEAILEAARQHPPGSRTGTRADGSPTASRV